MPDENIVVRYDAPLGLEKYRTDNGFLKVKATVGRVGVLEYRQADGSIRRELRHPDSVFSDESLTTLQQIPVTLGHPSRSEDGGLVTPANSKRLVVGNAGENPERRDGYLDLNLVITDAEAISAIEGGTSQVSPGYRVQLDHTPGVFNGEAYDAIQRNIRYNHIAIVDRGRAGETVRLHLDSDAEEVVQPKQEISMSEQETKQDSKLQNEIEQLMKNLAEAEAKAEGLSAQLEEEKKLREDAENPANNLAIVKARLNLEREARKLLGEEVNLDESSDREVRLMAAKAKWPEAGERLDDMSDEQVEAVFALASLTKEDVKQDEEDDKEDDQVNDELFASRQVGTRADQEDARAKFIKSLDDLSKAAAKKE